MPRARSKSSRKRRKTFSLAEDVVGFLESMQRANRSESLTGTIELLVREEMRRKENEKVAAEFAAYYDSLSDREVKEKDDWANVSGQALSESAEPQE